MPVNKQHDEFYTLDLTSGWETQPGYPKGIQQKILSGALDENAAVAVRTWRLHDRSVRARLLGKKSSLCRAIWQSVTTIRGREACHSHLSPMPAARPGAVHGPFRSDGGYLLMEIHYFDPV